MWGLPAAACLLGYVLFGLVSCLNVKDRHWAALATNGPFSLLCMGGFIFLATL